MGLSRVPITANKGRRHWNVDPKAIFIEDFNRPDEALSVQWSTDLAGFGTWSISGTELVSSGGLNGQWAWKVCPGIHPANMWAEVEATTQNDLSEIISVGVRVNSRATAGYIHRAVSYNADNLNSYSLERNGTGIASLTEPIILAPYRIRVEAFGDLITAKVWHNARWRTVAIAKDTTVATGNPGMEAQSVNGVATNFDKFKAGNTGQ